MKDRNWLRRVPPQKVAPLPDRLAETARTVERLDDAAALELLATAPYGRIVFVRHGRPEIRPLSHIVDDGEVIVRTRLDAALTRAVEHGDGLAATFEADLLDVERREGWSVIVNGTATLVTDPDVQSRYKMTLHTMLAGTDDKVIAIRPETVTGIRIVAAPSRPLAGHLGEPLP